jgi:signal transduction histidine kinase
VVRPLDRLERAANAIGAGDLTARAAVEGPPEVRRLAETFNTMGAKVDTLVRSQDAFLADASHQLRTPLAALRLRLENLDRDVTAPGKPELEGALTEVERLSALVDGLLTLARADRAPTSPQAIQLQAVVEERVAAWSAFADERDVHLENQLHADIAAFATPGRIEQILDNLLANALDATPEGATITVSAHRADVWVELHVIDEGPGMNADDRKRAFDRFWRAHDGGDGFGLGLAIVERLLVADGGEIELRESTSGGLDAVMRLRPATTRADAPLPSELEPRPRPV